MSGDVLGIGPLSDSSSGEALSVLHDWMGECVSNHRCGRLKPGDEEDGTEHPELPTRILEILADDSGSMVVRLIVSEGRHGRYAALSHSWGPPDKQPLRTTKATYDQHLSGIPAADLPKTFREAARVAYVVGLRYLWIDSLCIIQDDRDDWASEAPRMGPLYGRAALVIAASGATNSTEGCFLPRWSPRASLRIPYPAAAEGEQESHVVLQVRLPHTWIDPVFSPLGKRGWVLQEWMLARRLVHYTPAGMTWSCKQVQQMTEDGIHNGSTSGYDDQTWDGIIDSYTIRQLTFLSDKVIAVQGLADSMQWDPEKDSYHHGMWTSDMPQQLLWIGTHTTRPKELEGIPSWSWASTDGRCLTLSQRQFSWEPLPATLAVENGRTLVMRCQARRCSLKRWKEFHWKVAEQEEPLSRAAAPGTIMFNLPVHYTRKMAYLMIDEETEKAVGIAMLEDEAKAGEHVRGCSNAFLMKEIRAEYHKQPAVTSFSLVLQEAGQSDDAGVVHKRLGVGFVVDEDWIQGGTEQTFRVT